MPDIWMDVDAALAEVPVNLLPLIDDTDFKTIEAAVVYNQAGLALVWNFVTTAGAQTATSVTPTSGGDYDWTDQGTNGLYAIEMPASGGASANNDTEGFGWFSGVATGILPWRGPVIGFRAAGLNNILIDSAYSATRALAGTALPDAVADAAGGLPISDAGGLDLDTQLAATNEVTAARMGALTDWINGGRLDLLLDAIKVVTDSLTDIDTVADAIWDEILTGATHNIATSAGRRLRQLVGLVYTDGTAQAGGTNTITLAAGESATDNLFWQSYIAIVGGTGAGQGHHCISYNGTTKVAVLDDDWITTPDATSEYIIFGSGSHDEYMSGLAQAGAGSTITLESTADATDDRIKDAYISIISGTGAHQTRRVVAYNGTTKVATVTPDWAVNPDATSGYWILGEGRNNVWDTVLTGATHNVVDSSGRRVRDLQEFGVYEKGAIWIDIVNGAAGTTDYESGTVFNPVDSMADANTLAASLGIARFEIGIGSTITFIATQNDQLFSGHGWTLALGGQDVGGIHVVGPCSVSGIGTGATEVEFHHCEVGTVTLNKTHFDKCGFTGTVTLAAAAEYELEGCYSINNNTLILDFGAGVANTTVNLTGWNGKVELQNMGQTGTDVANIAGCGKVTINANCTGGTVTICGNIELSNSGSGQTINDDARVDVGQINTEVDNALDTALPASPTAGSVNDILDRQEETVVAGVASGTPTTTTIISDITITVDDQFNGRIITFRKDTTTVALRGQQTDITASTSADNSFTVTALATAPVSGDKFEIN